MKTSQRMSLISESVTLKLNAMVGEMKKRGEDVINLTAGEPDFQPQPEANAAIVRAVEEGKSRYTPVPGIPELREAVASKTNQQQPELGNPWTAANVVISNGGKQALFNTFMATLDPGDEVLIPAPFWLTYPELVKICGGTPKVIDCGADTEFKLTPAQLEQAIGPQTRAIVLNSPSNPTGQMYSRDEYAALAAVLKKHSDVMVISDEIYDRINHGDVEFASFLAAAPDLQDRTVTVNGMSKAHAMTGWRIGWTVCDESLAKAISKLQGQTTSGINALAQYASVASLALPEEQFADQVKSFRERRDLLLEILGQTGKLKIGRPQGAFYAFVDVGQMLGSGQTAVDFAESLLKEAKVAVVPGNAFGAPQSVRLSFAIDPKTLEAGCRRLVDYVEGKKG